VPTPSELRSDDVSIPWIELRGHLADALLLSSVLKSYHDASGKRVGILRRPPLSGLFVGHPAVASIATRPPVRPWVWWASHREHDADLSDWQRVARLLTENTIPDGALWAPCVDGEKVLASLPLSGRPLVIAPVPAIPRGDWARGNWCRLVEEIQLLTNIKTPLVVVAHPRVPGLPGCVNLSGMLTQQELLGLIGVSVGVVGVDPFVLRGAAMHGVPNFALLGPKWTGSDKMDHHIVVSGRRSCRGSCHSMPGGPALGPCEQLLPCMADLTVAQVMSVLRVQLLLPPTRRG
jgi:hypothetical protein